MACTPLKVARERSKSSTYDVSRSVGIAQSHFSRVENGETHASAELAQRLADYFGVNVSDIFEPSRYSSVPQTSMEKVDDATRT